MYYNKLQNCTRLAWQQNVSWQCLLKWIHIHACKHQIVKFCSLQKNHWCPTKPLLCVFNVQQRVFSPPSNEVTAGSKPSRPLLYNLIYPAFWILPGLQEAPLQLLYVTQLEAMSPNALGRVESKFSYRCRGAVTSKRHALARTPLAAVGVGSAAVTVGILVTSLSITVCKM